MEKKLLNYEGQCPFCGSCDLNYGTIELEGDMMYYPWKCEHCGHEGEEWYNLIFAGHNVVVDDIGTTMEVSELNKEVD